MIRPIGIQQIHRYAARRLGTQAADDIAAETFLIAFRRRASYDLSHRLARPWLYGIATTLIARHRRSEERFLRRCAVRAWTRCRSRWRTRSSAGSRRRTTTAGRVGQAGRRGRGRPPRDRAGPHRPSGALRAHPEPAGLPLPGDVRRDRRRPYLHCRTAARGQGGPPVVWSARLEAGIVDRPGERP
ncbi:sigma factor [Nonomuraea jabiensis]|uniref:RNA polymerase sigma factor n=1 Tax=Nonomuraea jabiensis TaxID=882448 RepID=UPI00341F6A52